MVSLIRRARDPQDFIVVVANFTPVPRPGYRIGVPEDGWYRELLNSDSETYGGGNVGNGGGVQADAKSHARLRLLDVADAAAARVRDAEETAPRTVAVRAR